MARARHHSSWPRIASSAPIVQGVFFAPDVVRNKREIETQLRPDEPGLCAEGRFLSGPDVDVPVLSLDVLQAPDKRLLMKIRYHTNRRPAKGPNGAGRKVHGPPDSQPHEWIVLMMACRLTRRTFARASMKGGKSLAQNVLARHGRCGGCLGA